MALPSFLFLLKFPAELPAAFVQKREPAQYLLMLMQTEIRCNSALFVLSAFASPYNAALCQIIGRYFHSNMVPRQHLYIMHAQLSGQMGLYHMPVLQLDLKYRVAA